MTVPLLRQAAARRVGLIRHDTSLAFGLALLVLLFGGQERRERRQLRRTRRRF